MATCLWHAIEYQGGTCPRCWQEKQQERLTDELKRISAEENRQRAEWGEDRVRREEELAERIEAANIEAAIQRDMQLRVAAEEQKRTIAEAPRIQARAMSERGYELYKVGLYEDAFQTSLKAIELDRMSIRATEIAAWALMKQDREREAKVYFEKQIALLSTSEYTHSLNCFVSVFNGLPNDDALFRSFSRALRKNSNLSLGGPAFDLIDTLINRKQLDDARQLIETLLEKPVQDLVDALIDREYLDEARDLTENLIRAGDSLMPEAYLLEITTRIGKPSIEKLSAFLQKISFNKRSDLLGSFETIISRNRRFSDKTIGQIKQAICQRYNQWKPEIENEIETAIRGIDNTKSGAGFGCGLIVLCFLGLCVIANILHSTRLQHLWLVTDGMKVFAPVSVFLSILIGVWGGHVIGRFRRGRYARQRIEVLEQQENQTWVSICSTPIPQNDQTGVLFSSSLSCF